MAVTLAVDEDYGYVILVGVLSMIFGYALGAIVFAARMRFGVKYPKMYSETNNQFNCIQRIHQNFLEIFPTYLTLLFCGGLANPLNCAFAGLVYLAGRVVYSVGYSTGDPNKRLFGLFGYLGLFYLLYSTVQLGMGLLRWI